MIFDSLINGAFNLGSTALQNSYNEKLAAQQNQYNLDMWNLQNAYNSPSAQMQRYEEAGLNPNLIYGSGSASAGNASSSPQMIAPQKNAPQLQVSDMLGDIMGLYNIKQAAENVNLKKEEVKSKRLENEAQTFLNSLLSPKLLAMQKVGSEYNNEPIGTDFTRDIVGYFLKDWTSNWNLKEANTANKNKATDVLDTDLSLKNIDLDWSKFEKTIGASTGLGRMVIDLLRVLLK